MNEGWDRQVLFETCLWALQRAWWDLQVGPILQDCYLQVKGWNYAKCLTFEEESLICRVIRGLSEKLLSATEQTFYWFVRLSIFCI